MDTCPLKPRVELNVHVTGHLCSPKLHPLEWGSPRGGFQGPGLDLLGSSQWARQLSVWG